MKDMVIKSLLPSWNIANKRIFLRADLNVPIVNNCIENDYKLKQTLPTINFILSQGGSIILATHIGRPANRDSHLSTKIVVDWFKNHNFPILFEPDLHAAYQKSLLLNKSIIMLENLRFFPGEKNNDLSFAQLLAQLADFYINDAFGLMHRTDTSISLLPELFDTEKRTVGFLVEKELAFLAPLRNHPKQPFVLIIGGSKLHDKIPLIKHMINKARYILLCPAISSTFAQALQYKIGKSLIETALISTCKTILEEAEKSKTTIVLPLDYQIKTNNTVTYCDANDFPEDAVALSIGPKTINLFTEYIKNAQTVFYNGLTGFIQEPQTLTGIRSLFEAMAQSSAVTIIGGGDSVGAAIKLGFEKKVSYLSTGGGATLAYLSGQQLPGLQPFINSD